MHIATILPAVFLVCFQFVPVIRYKAILFHRMNGYVIIILLLLANASAFMMMRHAVGGETQTQTWIGVLGVMTTVGIFLAWINIKRLQIDQHRAWMLRTWAWAGSIISLRLVMLAANKVVTNWYTYWIAIRCSEIFYMYTYYAGVPDSHNPTSLLYPQCTGPNSAAYVAIPTTPSNPARAGPENSAALFRSTFGLSGWIALVIHAILVELYLGLTPAESARLRQVSYERQLKAGFRHPEKGALTAARLGDAPPEWNSPLTLPGAEKHAGDSSDDDAARRVRQSTGTHVV
jgi:uncharacterized membrane protein